MSSNPTESKRALDSVETIDLPVCNVVEKKNVPNESVNANGFFSECKKNHDASTRSYTRSGIWIMLLVLRLAQRRPVPNRADVSDEQESALAHGILCDVKLNHSLVADLEHGLSDTALDEFTFQVTGALQIRWVAEAKRLHAVSPPFELSFVLGLPTAQFKLVLASSTSDGSTPWARGSVQVTSSHA